nr:hypothetical protein CFP56_29772 [Quercus suber]
MSTRINCCFSILNSDLVVNIHPHIWVLNTISFLEHGGESCLIKATKYCLNQYGITSFISGLTLAIYIHLHAYLD